MSSASCDRLCRRLCVDMAYQSSSMKRSLLCLLVCLCLEGAASTNGTTIILDPASVEQHDNFTKSDEKTMVLPDDKGHAEDAVSYMLSTRSSVTFGWGQETHRALTALSLAEAIHLQDHNEQKLMIKELELRLALALAKHHQEKFTSGQLALYINALLAVCQNPRDFYGVNLVSRLRNMDDAQFSYSYSLQSLALCNAGARFEKSRVFKLIEFLKEDPSEHGGIVDNLAMAVMALSCGQKYHELHAMDRYLRHGVKKLKRAQRADGSFGNIYSSALALQALIASETDDKNWNRSLSLEYILSQRRTDGSFTDFMGTFYSLPPLLNRSLVSLRNWSCHNAELTTDPVGEPTVTTVIDIKISINLLVRAHDIQEYRVDLYGFQNNSLYKMLVANEENISMEFKDTAYGHMIVGVDGINEDPNENKFWVIYAIKDGKEVSAETGVDGIYPQDNENYIFDLKSF